MDKQAAFEAGFHRQEKTASMGDCLGPTCPCHKILAKAKVKGQAKTAANRLAKAIRSAAAAPGNTLTSARNVARLTSVQEQTRPAVKAMSGRFKDVQDTIRKMPRLRTAALDLVRKGRL